MLLQVSELWWLISPISVQWALVDFEHVFSTRPTFEECVKERTWSSKLYASFPSFGKCTTHPWDDLRQWRSHPASFFMFVIHNDNFIVHSCGHDASNTAALYWMQFQVNHRDKKRRMCSINCVTTLLNLVGGGYVQMPRVHGHLASVQWVGRHSIW